MFKLQDCFLNSGVFNEALVKRFKENYNPENGSRLWMIPGHVVYTTPDQKVHTCDARPLDLLSPSEPCTGELISTSASILQIIFDTESASLRMYIALNNGDVQFFEYRTQLYEWARVGYFNVNITSPNNANDQSCVLEKVFIAFQQNKIFWCEKQASDTMNLTLYVRSLPLDSVREITQTTVGTTQALLKNCPEMELFEVSGNVFIIPKLPNQNYLYLILSARLHLWIFDLSGRCLWRGIVAEKTLDFLTLCMQVATLWTHGGELKLCRPMNYQNKLAYLFHNNTLITITPCGEVNSKMDFDTTITDEQECYIIWNSLCLSTADSFKFYCLQDGTLVQTISLKDYLPLRGIWCHSANIPCFGIYNDSTIYMLQPSALLSIFNSGESCYSKVLNTLSQGNIHLFALMKDIVFNKLSEKDLVSLNSVPDVLQSKALLLALYELCKSKGVETDSFPFTPACKQIILSSSMEIPSADTKLKSILQPLVDCYCEIEEAKRKL